jgi:benzoyl-CoA reductase/2-hydroxyglutaryl-CoA dehydratase subunit BcrC/BadD/HgdB
VVSTINTKGRIETLVKSCQVIERMNRNRPEVKRSENLYYRMLTEYFTNIMNAKKNGKKLALHTVFVPAEILYAMDIVPMHAETTTWMTAIFTGESSSVLAESARMGLATEICSAHRGLAGAYGLGVLPHPDMVLWSSLQCDNTAKSGELLMNINNAPGFFIDHPFGSNLNEKEYLTQELKDLIGFLEEQSGNKMDWDKLSNTVALMDRQIELSREITNLRKSIPTPFHPKRFFELLMNHYLFPGQPQAIEYLETLKMEMEEEVKEGKGVIQPERFRLMTLLVPPMYSLRFFSQIPQEYGAISVVEPLFNLWYEGRLDPEKPLNSIAKKISMFPEMCLYGPMNDRLIKATIDSAREYKVDGAICYAHIGCRQASSIIKVLKDVLNEIDIPMLTIDCDILDSTITSEEEMRNKIQQFIEMLEDR